MARSRQTVKVSGVTVIRTNNNSSRSRRKSGNSNGKRGNPNRCPACGRFM